MINRVNKLISGMIGRAIIMNGDIGLNIDDLIRLLSNNDDLYIALAGPVGKSAIFPEIFQKRILDRTAVNFVDRVKLITGQDGFEKVLILDDQPDAVRSALGIACVRGHVYLFFPPEGNVIVDMHNTLHYKNLVVKGVAE